MTVLLAMILDAIFGEPKAVWSRVPHPAVLMGRLIGWADTRFNTGEQRKQNGIFVVLALCVGAIVTGWFLSLFGMWIEVLVGAILIAHRSLIQHVQAVADALRLSVADGRMSVAMIVGRDTTEMDEPAIARAAIESAAENFSDGVIAPIFWFVVLGLPGLILYKLVNTADSMIGYRTERHEDFGWAAARLDDVLNWIPARLTAVLITIALRSWRYWPQAVIDARKHRSPNAGWPEAALAYGMGVALAGPRSYDGQLQDFPFVHPDGTEQSGPNDIDQAITSLWRAWQWAVAIVIIIAVI